MYSLINVVRDDAGRVLEQVGREEVAHVTFARRWFETFSGAPLTYARWADALPAPLSPSVLRGLPLNHEARRSAGFDEAFLEALETAPPTTLKSATCAPLERDVPACSPHDVAAERSGHSEGQHRP